jgi:hypothetical protein
MSAISERTYLYQDGNVRAVSGTQVGYSVEMFPAFDADYRGGPQHDVLPELATRLADDKEAQTRWEAVSPSLQKEVLRYLANLKSQEARSRNIERAMRALGGAKERFMAWDWN